MNDRTNLLAGLVALAAASVLAACGGTSDDEKPVIDGRSKLAFGPCAVSIADASTICGTLTVPEDRADEASRLIGLPFAILPAQAAVPARDPVVVFTGGPGPSPLRTLAELPADVLQQFPLRGKRDVIVMTQRGTDLTMPQSLDCSELAIDFAAGERFASEADVVSAAKACRDRLVAGGVKLGSYTTKTIVRDMEDLRVLLGTRRGFTQWNLVGSSYGSRLALAYMRDAPKGVRSAVLDGPFPLQERELYGAGVLDGLSAVLKACNAQPDCASAYPGLQARFATAIERLETTPALIEGTPVRGHQVLNVLRAALAVPQAPYGSIPLFMDRVARGDLAGADAVLPFLFNLILGINPEGMYYTVTCTDDAGTTTAASNEVPASGAGWPDAVRRLIAKNGLGLQASTCSLWTNGLRLSTDVLRPVRSDIPSLITVGQFDASTPSTSADLLLADLTRARKVVFTGRGHGLLQSDVCMLTVAAAFVDSPQAAPDASCVDTADSLRFVTPVTAAQMQPLLAEARGAGPGLAAGLVTSQSVLLAVDGKGSVASSAPLRTDQWFHLGSNGKSLTAMAVAVQVEAGRLKWTDTLGQLFPELAATMRPEYRQRTVLEVLGFRAGLLRLELFADFNAAGVNPGSLTSQRLDFARWLLAQPPINEPGTTSAYSNASYVLAGAIVERASGKPYERALQDTVLTPLGMKAAFGLPQSVSPDQPAAHTQLSPGVFEPIPPSDPLVLAVPAWASPAGLFCMPLADYARYAQVHLNALRGQPRLLSAASYRVLHTPQGNESGDPSGLAPGWSVRELGGGKKSYAFYGSIDVMNAYIQLLPDQDLGVVVLNNFDTGGQLEAVLGGAGTSLLGLIR